MKNIFTDITIAICMVIALPLILFSAAIASLQEFAVSLVIIILNVYNILLDFFYGSDDEEDE